MVAPVLGPVPFVGRDNDLNAVLDVLAPDRATDRSARRSRAAIVVGEPGVGKSRLAEEVTESFRSTNHEVSVVRVTAALGSVPLGTVATLVPFDGTPSGRRADLLMVAADALASDPRRLLVIDDAHLLDPMSAGAVHLAASRSPVRLLLTVRAGAHCDDAVTALWKDGLAERIDLVALDRAGTEALAAAILGAPLDGISAGHLFSSSGGNALFVRELLLGALDDGLISRTGDVHRFTARLRSSTRLTELLRARLDGVAAVEREALDLLAVGGEIGLPSLQSVVSDTVLATLEERGLIEVSSDGRRRPARLVHPLYGELLRSRMGSIRAMAMNRALAEQLSRHGARRRNDALDLARWQLSSGATPHPEVLLNAARLARSRFDPALAEQLATHAHDAGAGIDADLLVADALAARGFHETAAERLTAALDRAASDEEIVRAVSALSVIMFWSLGDERGAISLVETSARRTHGVPARSELDAHIATFEAMANRPTEALRRAEPHLSRPGTRPSLVAAIAAGPALTVVGRPMDAVTLMDAAIADRIADSDADALPEAFQYTVSKVFALSEAGELADAAALADGTYQFASSLHAVEPVAWSAMIGGRVALMVGDLATASTRFSEAEQLFDEIGETGLRSWSLAGSVLATAQRGDPIGAASRLAQLSSIDPGPVRAMQADVDRAVAWSARVAGDLRGAIATLEAAIADADDRGAHGMSLSLLHDLARCGDLSAVRLMTEDHRRVQGALAQQRIAFLESIAVHDGSGLDHVATGLADLGAVLFAAEAASTAAAAHRRSGSLRRSAASRARAVELHSRSRLAITPLLVSTSVAVGLTAREREIAELVAAGWSNRDVAEQLGRSVRTVENHLQRVYDKLGVARRTDLAVALNRSTLEVS